MDGSSCEERKVACPGFKAFLWDGGGGCAWEICVCYLVKSLSKTLAMFE